jgi:hypothetical protein
MDASLLRMVTRDLDAPKVLAAGDRAVIGKSPPILEAVEPCRNPLDLLSGIWKCSLPSINPSTTN